MSMFSRHRLIWLHLLPLFPVSKLDLRHTGRLRMSDNLLGEGMRGEGEEARSYNDESLVSITH